MSEFCEVPFNPMPRENMADAFCLHVYSGIDPGLVRENNQDRAFCWARNPAQGYSLALLLVADGMSGLRDGDVASDLAIDTLKRRLLPYLEQDLIRSPQPVSALARKVETTIQRANKLIYNMAPKDTGLGDMGTTLSCALVQGGYAVLAHVGDSRFYLLDRNGLEQIGEDHNLKMEQTTNKSILQQYEIDYPDGHLLTRALGLDAQVKVDVQTIKLNVGDRLLLCTDGLWRAMRDRKQFEQMVYRAETCEKAVRVLISAARTYGGDDNIAVVVCDVGPKGS